VDLCSTNELCKNRVSGANNFVAEKGRLNCIQKKGLYVAKHENVICEPNVHS
jgi:hypothetical protein